MISEIPFSYQEYLETILRISLKSKDETVKTSEIAKQLKVKAPSVTEMLDKLKSKDLIYYKKRKGVTLTEKGKKVGEQLLTNHRIIEYFLRFFLGIEDYHDIACKLEHHFNKEMAEKMLSLIGNPEITLEKDPIPELLDKIKTPEIINKDLAIQKINLAFENISKIMNDDNKKTLIKKEKQKLLESL